MIATEKVKLMDMDDRRATQDLLDRLVWLRARRARAEAYAQRWWAAVDRRDYQIASVRLALRKRGIVDVPRG